MEGKMKTCSKCKVEKPLEQYSKKGNGLQPVCKDCAKKFTREYYKKHPEAWKRYGEKLKKWAEENPELAKIKNKMDYANCAEKQKAYKKANYCSVIQREKNLARYGITTDDFNRILLQQNNCCEICKIELTATEKTAVDHCHTTGKVRGILCRNCNAGIGMLKESVTALESAIKYLQKHQK